jgi:hypothetical protein
VRGITLLTIDLNHGICRENKSMLPAVPGEIETSICGSC